MMLRNVIDNDVGNSRDHQLHWLLDAQMLSNGKRIPEQKK